MATDEANAIPLDFEVRRMLRAARVGTLATTADGAPFAALVTPAFTAGLDALLLLSTLSAHTRHLAADGHCALLVAGAAPEPNPQTTPRVTLTGRAVRDADPALKSRYLAIHPYAALYADFGDFAIWRLAIDHAAFVGGFARAHRLAAADLVPPPISVASVAAAEAAIIAHCNDRHADALAAIAGEKGEWRMVAVDPDGCDLACGETVRRVHWPRPAADADDIRAALIGLARAGRGA